MEKKCGLIIGGVGPDAGVAYQKIVTDKLGEHCKTDQEYPTTALITEPSMIGDRTAFLEERIDINPGDGAAKLVADYVRGFGKRYEKFIVSVPCNTFHALPIFERFIDECHAVEVEFGVSIEIVNLIQVTTEYIGLEFGNIKKVGLMSTTGTRKQRIYHKALEDIGFEIIEVSEAEQAELHETIYNKDWGIKGGGATSRAVSNFQNFAEVLKNNGAEIIILGCSEIPLVFEGSEFEGIPLVDPVEVMAQEICNKLLS